MTHVSWHTAASTGQLTCLREEIFLLFWFLNANGKLLANNLKENVKLDRNVLTHYKICLARTIKGSH